MMLSKLGRLRSGAAPIVLAAAMLSAPAFAQTPPQGATPTQGTEDVLGAQSSQTRNAEGQTAETRAAAGRATGTESGSDIVVTGSRIASPTITSVSPVQVISDVQIKQAGVANIQDLLLENPVFGSPAYARTNTAFLTSGTGAATVDLRNLGTDRTLVLINGRRVVAGIPGSATVDLNVIPAQFVQRIDVLTGGASSLYGSDAVAGVVNFVYKDNFEGLEANAQYGLTQKGDTRDYQANVTVGGNFAENRGNIMMHLGYTNQGQLLSRERSNTQIDDSDAFFGGFSTNPADFGTSIAPTYSAIAPQGTFTAGGCQFTFNPNTNALERGFSANGGTISAAQARACGVPAGTALPARGFNRQNFRTIAVPVERYLFAMRTHYDVTDNIRFIAEGTYAKTTASRNIEPFGFSSAGSTGAYPSGGSAPIETRVQAIGAAPGVTTVVRNPLVPDAIYNAATDTDGDGLKDIGFSRRLLEFGNRRSTTSRDFYRFVTGLEGDLFSDKFHWDFTYNYGRTTENQQGNGQINTVNFRNAFQVVTAQSLGLAGGTTPVCFSAQARAQGCVPVNIFGQNTISQQALAYLNAEQTFQTSVSQQVVQANLSGSLFDLPAGPLGIAVGGEYRRERSSANNDALTNAGLNGGNALPDTAGSFDVKEVYGEVNVPLLADTPFFQNLSLRGSGRISDYSTVGTVYSYSGGVEWSPIEDIRFAGTYARAVRAPNVGELFTGPSQTFPSVTDPCVGVTATTAGTLGTQCRAAAGVLANIAANNGAFAVTLADRQGVSGFNSGNPNLNEEQSDSYTGSVTINPRSIDFLRNTVLRVDYFNIRIKDAVSAPPRQFILDQCYRQGNPTYCAFIQRRATASAVNSAGTLEFVNAGSVNAGRLATEGLDVTLTQRVPLDGLGMDGAINARVAYTHTFTGYVIPLPGSARDNFAGEVGAAKDRFTANLGYTNERLNVNFTGTYFGRSALDDQTLAGRGLEPGAIKVPAKFYLDSQISFKAADQYELYFGADNLLNTKAPNILSLAPGNTTGTDTAAGVYDVFGRRYYAGVRFRF
ncbi:TonB-dependent receptor [uncultured Sphingomonas sp.]|uniref:TonB-dependent receptor domain-containing protein n=1 Tax=uncultured Sphingomonas sp. TaxID=158754 RepID=UPI0025E0A373|nr:TonB-dependent receptor [uncultured Sphingomonas sp.]